MEKSKARPAKSKDPVELERKELLKKVEEGDRWAVIQLMDHYLDHENPEDAVKPILSLLQKSAASESLLAAHALWRLYDETRYEPFNLIQPLIQSDLAQAVLWRNRAALWGHPAAIYARAREFFDLGDYDSVLTELERMEKLDLEFFKDHEEMVGELQEKGDDLIDDATEKRELKKQVEKILGTPEKASAEELYNVARGMIEYQPQLKVPAEAMQLLELSSQKGLMLAKKLLLQIRAHLSK